jgi:hypothetical protein
MPIKTPATMTLQKVRRQEYAEKSLGGGVDDVEE